MVVLGLVMLFLLGACVGSFLCCQARRLHRKEEQPRAKKLGNRSVCMECGHKIAWYDNIPLVSWILLRGRCRHCHKKIPLLEPLSEIGMALAFLLFGLTLTPVSPLAKLGCFAPLPESPVDGAVGYLVGPTFYDIADPTITILSWVVFLLALGLVSLLGFLAIYDGAYGKLPTGVLIVSIVFALAIAGLKGWAGYLTGGWSATLIVEPLAAALILGGLYFALYFGSKGRWVGDGDWLLALTIALALGTPWLALIVLALANLLACLVVLPKYQKHQRIPLGPYLVMAFVIVYAFQEFLGNLI